MPLAERAGFPTFWTTCGTGRRAALMIHCSLAHSGAWAGLARCLDQHATMTAFDMPGHGRSAPWDGRDEYQKVSTAIAETFTEATTPVDLIGHSFGATVALRLARDHPERVRTLTLIEPVLFAVALRDEPAITDRYMADMAPFAEAIEAGDLRGAARAFTALWGDGRPWESLAEAQREMLAAQIHLIPAGAPALHDDPGRLLEAGALDGVAMPSLLIEGAQSHWIVPLINAGLARRLPDARRAVIAEAGHMAPITHPRQVAREILDL